MGRFIMSWPSLGLKVRCRSLDVNQDAFALFVENMPVRALQGHEMVGGWLLRDHSILFNQNLFTIPAAELTTEKMDAAPVGRISLLQPQLRGAELLVKYDESVENREYVPIAQVEETDLEILKKAGKEQWKATSRTREIIFVEFEKEEA